MDILTKDFFSLRWMGDMVRFHLIKKKKVRNKPGGSKVSWKENEVTSAILANRITYDNYHRRIIFCL